jgi:predicted nucleic acid-binding protein
MAKFYIDTSIWVDYYENRKDRFRPLGEWAFELFRLINKNKDTVLFSEFVLEELGRIYDNSEIIKILSAVAIKQEVFITESQIREANVLHRRLNIPKFDIIHGVLARDNDAILVTRDNHFKEFKDSARIKMPEDII